MNRYIFLKVSLMLLLISGCSKDSNENGTSSETRTEADVRTDFANLQINPGINDLRLESITKGVYWNFRLVVPEEASENNRRPLLLHLHGGASNLIPDAHQSTDCILRSGFEDMHPYVVSPNSNGELWFSPSNQVQVLALLDLISSTLFVDNDKVAVTGFSDGGNGSWFYAQFYGVLFAAAIPISTSYNTENASGEVSPITIPLYVIHGSEDQLFPLETTEGFVTASIEAGSDIEFVVAEGLDHYSSCDLYTPYLMDASDWLANIWQ
ncbi:MAG: dienelactone hydrolase family protein [Bacteroidota bacterium]|nr:dienelactone hydrolase family protein [Bacteroidota bacterium]